MLLEKTCSKREVMSEIWEKRGVIVTESSYYKLVRQLRKSFANAGLDDSLIMTLPRIGISYCGTKEVILQEAVESKSGSPALFIKNKPITVASLLIAISAIGLISGVIL
jgi:DNA-binding winged helix-turn-helix (wHTH) protein